MQRRARRQDGDKSLQAHTPTGPIQHWREVTKSAAEAVIWTSQTLASGMVPYYHVVGGEKGLGEDLRWEKIRRDCFPLDSVARRALKR